MINYRILPLCRILDQLRDLQNDFDARVTFVDAEIKHGEGYEAVVKSGVPHDVSDTDRAHILKLLTLLDDQSHALKLDDVKYKTHKFRQRIQARAASIYEVALEAKILLETMDSDLSKTCFHSYSADKVLELKNVEQNWFDAFTKFPKLKSNIVAAVDCYAISHNLGAVFYLMHAMEAAVHEFAKKLGVNFVKKNPGKRISELSWENILNDMNPKLRAMSQKTLLQKRRFEKYSATQSYLYAVKDAWRNSTMHPRRSGYNDLETLNIINNVRSFMTEFAGII